VNYLKQYIKLMRKAQGRNPLELEGIYTEKHHVFPKSMFGKNDYLVELTFKEHIVAHHLLYKICLVRYGLKHKFTVKMAYALSCTLNINHRVGEELKTIHFINKIKKSIKIKRVPTKETCEKISKSNKGKIVTEETRKKISEAHKGKKLSSEHRKKIGDANRGEKNNNYGKKMSKETRQKMSEARKGIKLSPEHRANISKGGMGKKHTEEFCKKISERQIGENNPLYDKTKYNWYNEEKGLFIFNKTQHEMQKAYPELTRSNTSRLVNKKLLTSRKWMLLETFLVYDKILEERKQERSEKTKAKQMGEDSHFCSKTTYNWYNEEKGLFLFGKTQHEIRQLYPELTKSNTSELVIKRKNSSKGWRLLETFLELK
jgi:hypothetical protein